VTSFINSGDVDAPWLSAQLTAVGTLLWSLQVPCSTFSGSFAFPSTTAPNAVFVAVCGTKYIAYNVSTGLPAWTFSFAGLSVSPLRNTDAQFPFAVIPSGQSDLFISPLVLPAKLRPLVARSAGAAPCLRLASPSR